MAAFEFRKRRTRRLWSFGLTTAAITAAVLFLVSAAGGTLTTGSTFNTGNGDLTDTSIHDWNPAGSPAGNIGPVETITCPPAAPGAGTNCGLDLTGKAVDSNGNGDNAYGQGSKEDDLSPTVVFGSIPPSKDDLSRFYVNKERHACSTNCGGNSSHDFLYLAWERTNLLGSAHMDFEFNQLSCNLALNPTNCAANNVNPVRSLGDLLVDFDFGGSGVPVLAVHTWIATSNTSDCETSNTSPCWSKGVNLTAAGYAEGSVNGTPVKDYNPPVPADPGYNTLDGSTKTSGQTPTVSSTFGEAALDLTGAGIFSQSTCKHFGSASLKSRSSGNSFTSELKDFIAPIPVNISNCGTVIIHKVTDPSTDTTTSFGYTDNIVTAPATTQSFSLVGGPSPGTAAAQTKTIANVLPGTSLNVTENDPSGNSYTLTALGCTAESTATNIVKSVANRKVTFDIAADETLECTFTNTKNKANPDATTAPTLIPQDSATVSGFDDSGSKAGLLHFSLWDNSSCTGTPLYTKDRTVTANGTYTTDNSGVGPSPDGYTITSTGTFYWKVVYDGDTRNNGFTKDCTEIADVTLTPDPSS
jgi:hypothetical protein